MKRLEITARATVTIDETWRVDLPDDAELPEGDDALDYLGNGGARFLRERSLGDEHDREVVELAWVEIPPEHQARPDDDPEPGDRCKDCGENVTWVGPFDNWEHADL